MHIALLLLGAGCVFADYNSKPSGYGNNNPNEVQQMANKSPRNKPVDYTRSDDFPGFNLIGNNFKQQNLGQVNTQGQLNLQKGGDQTNAGLNQNQVNVGQGNNQNGGGRKGYDAPYRPGNQGGYNPATKILGNKFDLQTLGQANTQGQQSAQIGGAQTNIGQNQNAVNVGQTNNQGGAESNGGYRPSYDVPSYGAVLIPINPVTGGYAGAGAAGYIMDNRFDIQNLGQVSNQGQANLQQGGDQTNVGANANTVNVGQQNNQGGAGAGNRPSYDAPSYGGGPIYIPDFNNFIKNNVYSQTLEKANTQGQQNVQKGGDQTNVGVNSNAVNVGQQNNQRTTGTGPSYDSRRRPNVRQPVRRPAPVRRPTPPVRKPTPVKAPPSKPQVQSPAPRETGQGQGNSNVQNPGPGSPQGQVGGNKAREQNLGQGNTQGQSNFQKGGEQTNVGINSNVINVSQTNNQSVNGNKQSDPVPQSDSGSGYRRRS